MKNTIKTNYEKGINSVGTVTQLKSRAAVEAIGTTGMDYIFIDGEHASFTTGEIEGQIIAANAADITPIVRVPSFDRRGILHALDAGACGIVVPCIENVDQAKQCVDYSKYPPLGKRGFCMTRVGKWGAGEEYHDGLSGYMRVANESTLLFLQCETIPCLENLEEIANLDGVDGIMLGPYDLSTAMGIPGEFENEKFLTAMDRVVSVCKDKGKISMVFCGDSEDALKKKKVGFDSLLVGVDVSQLITGFQRTVSEIR